MFRELTRKNKKLSEGECYDLLANEKRGVLAVLGDGGYPYCTPMNHYLDKATSKIYFHCGKKGHRLDSIKNNNRVSFCVYDKGYKKDGEWALNVKSVIVFGKIEIIDDYDVIADITTKLSLKFTNDEQYIKNEIECHAEHTLLLCLTPENICGKLVNES